MKEWRENEFELAVSEGGGLSGAAASRRSVQFSSVQFSSVQFSQQTAAVLSDRLSESQLSHSAPSIAPLRCLRSFIL